MGSRLKQNPERTFYWFFEATCPVARDKDPGVLFRFPEDFSDEESCQTSPRFCFPYDIQRARESVAVQHFTFVLTDLEGCQRFGFCRLTNNTNTCLCILSYLPWFEVFYKLLNNLADFLTKGQTNETKALLAALYEQPPPPPDGAVTLQMVPYFIAPDPKSLPSIPENRNLTELIVAVDVGNLLHLYASMLFERRILISSSKLSTLTACVHALSALLYPMYWQHIFIPVLPPHLLDYCCAPMPYLIGVHTSLSEKVRSRGLEEVVILNVDTNTLETPFDDLKRIPSEVMSGLKACLKRQAVSPGCGVSRAYLKAQALLFGGYKDALQGQQEGEVWFSEEIFQDHKSASMRQFLQSAVHLQSFKQFIDGRLDILNEDKVPDDLFEEEILKCESAGGRSKSYQQLVGNLKKGGGALILNMKSKANMRAKGLAKSGLKNLLMHKAHNEEHSLQRGGSVSHRRAKSDCLQNRLPITQHFGRSRPRRPVHKLRASRDKEDVQDVGDAWAGAESEPAVGPDSELQKDQEEGDDSSPCDSEEMDLLGEIFDTLSSRSSQERGLLYGTRSLDLFGPDSHDYITKGRFPPNPSQESLSGSGSLHSWNLETTEELSDLTEDSDWLGLDTSAPEQEGTDSLLVVCDQEFRDREFGEEEVKVAINGNQEEEIDNRKNVEEVSLDKETKEEGIGKGVSVGEDPGTEMAEEREDKRLRGNKKDEQNPKEEVAEGQEMKESEIQKEEEGKDKQEEIKYDTLDKLIIPNPHQTNAMEDNLNPTSPSGLRQLLEDPESPAAQENSSEEAVKEQETRRSPSTPKVLPAAARFQLQAHGRGFQVKSRTEELSEPGRPRNKLQSKDTAQTSCDSNAPEAAINEDEDLPLIKVSELKKRFEA
ncbi:DENN domain-containing protein 1B isoform X2 [Pungitius pungitius]|uniref:DENN domain-containing protein 1B isoform X2 n=1 Tax=Pungitius pungitius TaxID=134920 RepID=UPI002E13A016